MTTNSEKSLSISVSRDLSHCSSAGEKVHPSEIIPPTSPNHLISTFNIGNSSSYSTVGHATNGNTAGSPRSKPRGRPPGSKNRPKRENMDMKPVTLDVPDGVNIIDLVAGFANSNKVCITVVGGVGKVSLAIFSSQASQAPPDVYEEHLTLINLSGTHLLSPSTENSPTIFNALLGRANGEVIGGEASRMVALGKVGLSAYVFQNPDIINIKAEVH